VARDPERHVAIQKFARPTHRPETRHDTHLGPAHECGANPDADEGPAIARKTPITTPIRCRLAHGHLVAVFEHDGSIDRDQRPNAMDSWTDKGKRQPAE
jgi:hypothetical protein